MEENVGNPLILGKPFLATSRALIDMESDLYEVEEDNPPSPAPPDKGPKKKSKGEKGTHDSVKFQHFQKAPNVPYPPVIVGSNNKASSKGVGNQTFEPT
ncbi:hypothetical protein PIB30_075816 [Stylosanthes scabra]|uniref:Uncharacterized protein n=1 Tax=Stylosanthes scabra TaxID=79078 RepID=A0ABU6QQ78_9FABA|nr:hypothetical protein [Stylosanthes scabra]